MRGLDHRTAVLMNQSEGLRFVRRVRILHWANAAVVIVLIATGMHMYVPAIGSNIGYRTQVKYLHTYAGVLLPLLLILPALGRQGRSVRDETRQLGRWHPGEGKWIFSLGIAGRKTGKYNPGQKASASMMAGALMILWTTGLLLFQFSWFSDSTRTSATFTHDVFAMLLTALIAGHILIALLHPKLMRAMLFGR